MSDELSAVTGVRQAVTAVLPISLPNTPPWPEGPFPFTLGSRTTDTAMRQTYFTPAAARSLYGSPSRPCRWHRPADITHGPLRLHGLELLRTATAQHPDHALAVLHCTVEGPRLLNVLRAIGHRHTAEPDPLSGPLSPQTLLDGIAAIRTATAPFSIARPYTIAFFTPDTGHTPALRPTPTAAVPGAADRWLWELASRSSHTDYPVAPEREPQLREETVRISADWSALVLRNGAAFLGNRPDTGDGDFYDFALLHTRTVYLDALLLGTVQRDHINEIGDELSAVFDSRRLARRVAALERRIAHFRSTYWRQHLTAHGPANDLLLAFQAQHRLPERFAEIVTEAADYSQLVQAQENQQISGALGVLTILGLPLGTALSILQVLGAGSPTALTLGLTTALAATGGALTTRYGRLVLSSLRGGDAGDPTE